MVHKAGPLAIGRGGAAILAAAWLVLAARTLPLRSYGDLAVLLALGAVFSTVSDGGTVAILAQDTARRGHLDRTLFRQVLQRRTVACLLAEAALVGLYLWAASERDVVAPLLFGVSILSSAAYGSALSAYRALGHVRLDSLNELASRALVLGVGWLLLTHGGGLRAAVATYAGADLVSAALIVPAVLKGFGASVKGPALPGLSLAATLPYVLAGGLVVIYYRIDTYLVGLIGGSEQAALYGAAYKLVDGCLIPALAVEGMVMALTVRLVGPEKWRRGKRLIVMAAAVTVPAVAIGTVLATQIMVGLFGLRFSAAAPILQLLLVSALPAAVVVVLVPMASTVWPYGYAFASGVALAVNLLLNIALIPVFGGLGAAAVNVVTQVLLAGILVTLLRRRLLPRRGAPC